MAEIEQSGRSVPVELEEDYETLFAKRYTEEDEVYMKYVKRGLEAPPVVDNFHSRLEHSTYRDREREGGRQYRDGYRNNQDRGERSYDSRNEARNWNYQRSYREREDYRGGQWGNNRNQLGNQREWRNDGNRWQERGRSYDQNRDSPGGWT